MPCLRYACRVIFTLVVSVTALTLTLQPPSHLAGDDEPADESEKQAAKALKERYTNWMRTYAEGTKIKVPGKGDSGVTEKHGEHPADLVPNPVFRYSDEQRAVSDATLWVWTRNARPVGFQKVEVLNRRDGSSAWRICFASLSEGLVTVDWPKGRDYAALKPGVTFSPIPRAETPAETSRARTIQIKTLKERFSGRLFVKDDGTGGSETRTMARPIFEYADPETKLPWGAIFGMSSTGTNPDLLLLIEARRNSDGKWNWEYAFARMTATSIRVRLDDTEVWAEAAIVDFRNTVYENWTLYSFNRDF